MSESIVPEQGSGPESVVTDPFAQRLKEAEALLNTLDRTEQYEIAQKLEEELTAECPYYQETVVFCGPGIEPTFDENGIIRGSQYALYETSFGVSAGVGFARVPQGDETDRIKAYHKIEVGQFSYASNPTMPLKDIPLYFCLFPEGKVMPTDSIENIYHLPPPTNETLAQIGETSARFNNLLASTSFRKLSHRRQIERVDNFMRKADRRIRLRSQPFILETEFCYVPIIGDNEVQQQFLDTSNILIGGECLGVGSIEQTELLSKPIRHDEDILALGAGLCLLIAPDDDTTKGLNLDKKQVLFIPLGNQKITLQIG